MRALCTPVMKRKLLALSVLLPAPPADPASPAMPPHSVWLKTLKASARNSKAKLSLMAKCLNSAMSKFVRRGLRSLFLPELPKVSPVGTAKAAGLYHRGPTLGAEVREKPAFGSPTISAREPEPTPAATPALSVELSTLNGVPLETPTIPEYCHPPRSVWRSPAPLKNGTS